jgi:hypothetical protein
MRELFQELEWVLRLHGGVLNGCTTA